MKSINTRAIAVTVALLASFSIANRVATCEQEAVARQAEPLTILFVRHADRLGEDDALTEDGKERAKHLGSLAAALRVDAIYSTETTRTTETAQPAALLLELPIEKYAFVPGRPDPDWFQEIAEKHAGQTLLIVGHSNTLHGLIQGFGGEGSYPIGHDEYDRIYIVSVEANDTQVVPIRFGAPASGEADQRP